MGALDNARTTRPVGRGGVLSRGISNLDNQKMYPKCEMPFKNPQVIVPLLRHHSEATAAKNRRRTGPPVAALEMEARDVRAILHPIAFHQRAIAYSGPISATDAQECLLSILRLIQNWDKLLRYLYTKYHLLKNPAKGLKALWTRSAPSRLCRH